MIMTKKGIVLVSFGVADKQQKEKTLDVIVNLINKELPDFIVRQAYTSKFMLKKSQNNGISINDLTHELKNMAEQGIKEVYVQPTHIAPGEEYQQKILPVQQECERLFEKLVFGRPILTKCAEKGTDDYTELTELLLSCAKSLDGAAALVCMGHGSPHIHNTAYEILQKKLHCHTDKVFVGVLEENDYPNLADVINKLQADSYGAVHLMPLLLTAGNHVNKDMLGDNGDSWKSRLEKVGFKVSAERKGLAELAEFRRIYINRLKELIGR